MVDPALVGRVSRLLQSAFPGVQLNIEPAASAERITGWVVWGGFESLDQVERQQRMRQVLATMPQDDRVHVGPILTLTPSEASDEQAA